MADQGQTYAGFVAGELDQERKRRELLDGRATGTIASSAALVGLAVAVGIFDPDSIADGPRWLRWGFLLGAGFTMASAVLALFAGWLHGYQVLDSDGVTKLLTRHWDESEVMARSRVAQFNADTLSTLRSGNDTKAIKLMVAHVLQLVGLLLLLAVALGAALRSF